MDNLAIYNAVRKVPENAKTPIAGGPLKGKTDINPMWRIKALTEQFGPCGIGWKYEITDKRLENGANGDIAAFLDINLYVKAGDTWSDAIPGTGGNSFVGKDKNGIHTSDECFKMALTDAISVACKALGFGADVYWKTDQSKYGKYNETTKRNEHSHAENPPAGKEPAGPQEHTGPICDRCGCIILPQTVNGKELPVADIVSRSTAKYKKQLCLACARAINAENKA